jgi:hypothetical protein
MFTLGWKGDGRATVGDCRNLVDLYNENIRQCGRQ